MGSCCVTRGPRLELCDRLDGWETGVLTREDTHTYTQHCKAVILQFKKKKTPPKSCLPFKSHCECHLHEAFSDAHLLPNEIWKTVFPHHEPQRMVFTFNDTCLSFYSAPRACFLSAWRLSAPLRQCLFFWGFGAWGWGCSFFLF